ncbi:MULTISPECIES: hypothetical protein [Sinorhizobium]|uniref:Uncharacterized protein n=1 Tax=Sinorhizobium kummerowiae TaxID=158892 RepID=A0ABY8T289_9HYPH|nr:MULTISPECIES: hypothetical protein [Sinorhizobium]RVE92076.1 hypothetical protein CN238_05080 [Sinorhizobium meliloti]RVG75580.1 hypothetical protein CN220_01910 [Sinorhizobium meliloti]RVH12150.1 hypothetical protein CN216_24555 [Sinorhizobium meliloti]RVH35193.1 hypothetical protein CN214_03730 [Sinorhizobium meliloti]WHS91275.1 hypothetical protein PZL22_001235 [Sinorhizobium kummerowiae]
MTHQQQPIRHRHHQKSVLSFDPSRFDGPNASGEATSIALRYWEGHHGRGFVEGHPLYLALDGGSEIQS